MLALLKNKNFSLLFAGSFVSRIGSTFYNFAVGWFLLTLTESPLIMGLYIALGAIIELVLSPIGGVYADRVNKVRMLYLTDYIRGFVVLIAGLLLFTMNTESYLLVILFTVTIILAINNAFFFPSANALLPEVITDEALNQGNAFFSLINSIQTIIGILLAGILYALLGIEWIFIINGISFIVSAMSEMFIKTPYHTNEAKKATGFVKKDFIEGLTYMRNKRGFIAFMLGALLINFATAPLFVNALPYLFNLVLEKTPLHLSIIQIAFPLGMILGGILVGIKGDGLVIKHSIKRGLTATSIGLGLIALLMHLVATSQIAYPLFMSLIIPIFFLTAIGNMFLNIPFSTGIVRLIDKEYRGRVLSIMQTLAQAMMPLSFILAGVILEVTSISTLLLFILLLMIYPYTLMMFGKRPNELMRTL
jgi:MFS family permease